MMTDRGLRRCAMSFSHNILHGCADLRTVLRIFVTPNSPDNMKSDQLTFVLFGNDYRKNATATVSKILTFLLDRGAKIYMETALHDYLATHEPRLCEGIEPFGSIDVDADFAISMGGDGTFLRAAAHVIDRNIPLLGINTGRLGYLADVHPCDVESALSVILDGKYTLEQRSVLQVTCGASELLAHPYALNDIAILKRDNASMIDIKTIVDEEHIITYRADGLIVSTPTGSTAYSLSNGGPIMVPQAPIIGLTPVAPHSLGIRPLVLSDDVEIQLHVASRSHNYLVAVDGRSVSCSDDNPLIIRKAPRQLPMLKTGRQSYFTTLKEKMMWGRDNREEECP